MQNILFENMFCLLNILRQKCCFCIKMFNVLNVLCINMSNIMDILRKMMALFLSLHKFFPISIIIVLMVAEVEPFAILSVAEVFDLFLKKGDFVCAAVAFFSIFAVE